MKTTTKLYAQQEGIHVHVDIFSGPANSTRGKNGHLVFRLEEWETFITALQEGINNGTILLEFSKR